MYLETPQRGVSTDMAEDRDGLFGSRWVNGSKVATWANIASNWTNYSQSVTLSGKDVIDVVFTNDCFGGGYDRNLYVDYVIVDGTTIQAEGGAAILDRGAGTGAFDGQDVIMGQEAINWGGALRLVKGEGAFIGGYDGNGNLTSRVVNGAAFLLAYDAENHLVSVSGAVTASFVYDGDGRRVKGTIGSVTTTYIGNYLEWSGSTSTMKRYYYAGSTRVAMRTGSSTLNYLLGDHLSSMAITTDSSGANPAEIRYYPWGKDRYTSGTTPTTFRFTGQRLESSFGLYFYNSRWYDPNIGRFIQADTIVPGAGNSQAYDRYAYVFNNPLKYVDPFGYRKCSSDEAANGDETCEQNYPENDVDYILHLVIMKMIPIADYLGQLADPDESASGGSGEPKGYSRVPGDEYQIDIFIWLSYKEYKDRSVSPYEITINNSSKETTINIDFTKIISSSVLPNLVPLPPYEPNPEPSYITPLKYTILPQNSPYLASIKPEQYQTVSLGIYSDQPICQYNYPRISGVFMVNISIYYLINTFPSSRSYTIPPSWSR